MMDQQSFQAIVSCVKDCELILVAASAAFAEAKALLDTVIKCQENGTLIEGLNFGSSVIEQVFQVALLLKQFFKDIYFI